ncbi:Mss4-like protein [Massariosphaeria phaeospora]|uniref:Mss4-like protein n=1 Tax=Massariosphaeria phaeospora TaxID=100035 RepID=A0A7C8MSR0_9PLEO|nr:Mss4-like protein [Massariosphaeria phaeospora]
MSTAKPFPSLKGGCFCGLVRYRLHSAPLFCHACYCLDCQKLTGSAFSLFASIEFDRVTSIGAVPPKVVATSRKSGSVRQEFTCAECGTVMWTTGDWSPATADIRVGTLEMARLMEPDMHCYIENKFDWVVLPADARTCKGQYDFKTTWPKDSVKRLDECMDRIEKMGKDSTATNGDATKQTATEGDADGEVDGALDKTPTAQSPEEKEELDDEEFERRFNETERVLQERLEKLTLKLNEQDKETSDQSSSAAPDG